MKLTIQYIVKGIAGIVLLFFSSFLCAQPTNNIVGDVVMPAPNAAALGKYGDIPVGHHTGVPSISVPIHTLTEGNLSVPVSLNYHASGVKVAETASWVGLGWSLNAGGVITRTVQGIPDEGCMGYWEVGTSLPSNLNINTYNTFANIKNGQLDSEPDIFSFNVGGVSGKFYINADNNFVLIPKQDVKIKIDLDNNCSETFRIKSFTVITTEGNKYFFGTHPHTNATAIEHSTSGTGNGIPSSWYLMRIESFDGVNFIDFTYQDDNYGYTYASSCQGNASSIIPNCPTRGQRVTGKNIASITTSTEIITFTGNTDRLDLEDFLGPMGGKRLDQIKVSTTNMSYCKQFDLSYDYFEDNSSFKKNKSVDLRLQLKSVQEKSCDGSINNIPPYTFEYYGPTISNGRNFLANRHSKAIDHWGFYNGENDNENTIYHLNIPPTTINQLINGNPLPITRGESNRDTKEEPMKYGVLNKINYPTGGFTSFIYEANDYHGSFQSNQILLEHSRPCGGFTTSTSSIPIQEAGELTYDLSVNYCNGIIGNAFIIRLLDNQGTVLGTYSANPSINPYNENGLLSDVFPQITNNNTYKFEFTSQNGNDVPEMNFKIEGPSTNTENIKVGGLRIKEIKTNDGITTNDIIRTYKYTQLSDDSKSSGYLYNQPIYGIGLHSTIYGSGEVFYNATTGTENTIDALFLENSIVALAGFEGHHITYERVVEDFSGNGYKEYVFYSEQPYYEPNLNYPLPPELPRIVAGKMASEAIYKQNNNGSFTSVSRTNNLPLVENYEFSTHNMLKVADVNGSAAYNFYNIRSRPYRLLKVNSLLDGVETTQLYDYDPSENHLFPISITTTNSDSKVHTTNHEYVYDFSGAVYDSMISRNMIAMPIRTTQKVNGQSIGGTYQVYDFFDDNGLAGGQNDDPIYPKESYNYEVTWDENGTEVIEGNNNDPWKLQHTILEYDPLAGKPTKVQQDGWEVQQYSYNDQNKLIDTITYKDFVKTYAYYPNTRLISEYTDIDKQKIQYEYDDLMRLKKIKARNDKVITDLDYQFIGGTNTHNYINQKITYNYGNQSVAGSSLTNMESRQYFDGLGRVMQTVQLKHTENQKDVITALSYDNQGRLSKEYEVFESIMADGSFVSTIPPNTPYKLVEYEASPLNRAYKNTLAGWNNYPTHTLYGTNVTAITIPGTSITFQAGQLFKNTVIEPDINGSMTGDKTITYTDKLGRLVLSQRETGTASTVSDGFEQNNTYHIYDDKNRVHKIIPPGADASAANDNLIYTYLYDGANNMIEKRLPDSKKIEYIYDARDLQIGMRDGNMRMDNNWMINQYDAYGRVIKTGLHNNAGVPNANSNIPFSAVWTENYYDGIRSNGSNSTEDIYRGKLKETRTAILNGNAPSNMLRTYYTYDDFGRVTLSNLEHHLQNVFGGNQSFIFTTSNYDLADNIVSNALIFKKQITDSGLAITNKSNIDHQGRLKSMAHIIANGGTSNEVQLSELSYTIKDEILQKKLGGTSNNNFLQTIDYSYLANGFLTSINGTMSSDDLFKLELAYNNPVMSGVQGQYNGNISQLFWKTKGSEEKSYGYAYDYLDRLKAANYVVYDNARSNTSQLGHYNTTYSYDARGNFDQLARHTSHWDGTTWSQRKIDDLQYNYYDYSNRIKKIEESATCPQNKYIQAPVHLDGTHAAGSKIFASSKVDGIANITYQAGEKIVFSDGFSVGALEDGRFETNIQSPCPTFNANTGGFEQTSDNDYIYDKNGNLTRDPNKKMDIYYNYLNLPYKVVYDNGNTIEWLYDASGTKLQKKSSKGTNQAEVSTRDYIAGIELQDGEIEAIYHAEGRALAKNGGYEYQYNLADHLGNNRVLFADADNNETPEIIQENHYYPFGLQMQGEWNSSSSPKNSYLYNGKEIDTDFGLNFYHYGARIYDPTIGRFTGIDPLAGDYPKWSPYNYVLGNPVNLIDPDGKRPTPAEAAKMASHVYGDKSDDFLSGGWAVSQRDFGIDLQDETGLKSQVYERTVDGVTEYTYATAGTEKNWNDIKADVTQPLGLSKQYSSSAENAKLISNQLGDNVELTFTGHSLGGGEAALNSMVTTTMENRENRMAITFNAAGVSPLTKLAEGGALSGAIISAIIMITDPLNALQKASPLLPSANGNKSYIKPTNRSSYINGHSIDNIVKELDKLKNNE